MRLRIILVLSLLLITVSQAFALEEMTIKNMWFSRMVSGTVGILKTTKLEANGVQLLDQPSVEFMVDVEYKGKIISLLPGDFDVMDVKTSEVNKVTKTSIEMLSHNSDFPLRVSVDYYSEPKALYMQKSIHIAPCKKPSGAVLKRVSIEYFRLKDAYMPVVPLNRYVLEPGDETKAISSDVKNDFGFEGYSDFAVVDPKTNKGIFFVAEPQRAKIFATSRHYLTITEEANVPIEKGYETARTTIGVAAGPPEIIYKQYREYLLNSRCAMLGSSKKLGEFKKKFNTYFQACQYVSIPLESMGIDAEAHAVGNKGFIILFNSSDKPQKIALPLDEPNLGLAGEVKLSDWTGLDSSSDMGAAGAGDKVEIEIGPGLMKIIGINIASE